MSTTANHSQRFQHFHCMTRFTQTIGGSESGWARTNDGNVHK